MRRTWNKDWAVSLSDLELQDRQVYGLKGRGQEHTMEGSELKSDLPKVEMT